MQAGVGFFCFVFAVNSAVHSYLVLRYADGNKVAVNVGFYYMSNAVGRLVGTILSGVLYTFAGATVTDGFGWCFVASAAFVAICTALTMFIRDDEDGLRCGGLICVRPPHVKKEDTSADDSAPTKSLSLPRSEEGVHPVPPAAVEEAVPLDKEAEGGLDRARGALEDSAAGGLARPRAGVTLTPSDSTHGFVGEGAADARGAEASVPS